MASVVAESSPPDKSTTALVISIRHRYQPKAQVQFRGVEDTLEEDSSPPCITALVLRPTIVYAVEPASVPGGDHAAPMQQAPKDQACHKRVKTELDRLNLI